MDHIKKEQEEDPELLLYDLSVIAFCIDNFLDKNKLGEGGFGSVFKGTLENGQRIVVKRLSIGSGQGIKEFKNEITLINEEKLLIYEYMPNKSLDVHCWKFPCLCNWKRTKLLWHESMSMNLNGTEVLGFGLVLWWKYKHNQQAFFDVKGVCYLSTDFPHAHFLRVEVEEQPEISEAYSVSAVPFFVFFKVRFDLTRLVLIPSMIMFLLS
ncbi:hypothetical protein AHAS_Ahas05G0101800 [Arachis hypogaea]